GVGNAPAGPRPPWAADECRRNESRPRAPTRTRRRSPLRGAPRRLLASPPQGRLAPPLGGGVGNSRSTASRPRHGPAVQSRPSANIVSVGIVNYSPFAALSAALKSSLPS